MLPYSKRLICAITLSASGISACASLPDAPRPALIKNAQAVEIENENGPVSRREKIAVLNEIKQEAGNSDILKKHLALEQAINRDSPLVTGNRLTLLQDGPATYNAMFAAIRAAKDHINLETYIFEDGEIGTRFADLLLEKQAAGVQVNIIYDSVGSLDTPQEFFDRLSSGGIELLEYNPVNPAKVQGKEWLLNNRDHRKLLVVDGKTVFLGGINISESYSRGSSSLSKGSRKRDSEAVEAGWRDTHLQIDGPAAESFQKYFMDTWTSQKGPALAERNYFPKLEKKGDEIVRAIGSKSDDPESPIYQTLLSAIDHADRSIRLTNAYFVPDPGLLKALKDAARRGVQVEIILPGKTDSWIVFHAGRSHYTALLDAGVKLYERQGAVLHSKTATIDGVWSTIGSTNLDWRSFLHNDELNAIVLGAGFSDQMKAMFAKDRAASHLITPEEWKRRSLLMRIKEWLAVRFEYWL
ncbi:MAG: cardiolipin synthase [Thiobacillus sp.]|nr:cardiolipin synthase [Thiobacillus sp.]